MFFFFFFQAEDGIRDVAVTGVQTCALPISIFAFLFACIWLCNAPAGVIASYSMALLFVWAAIRAKSLAPVWRGACGLTLGFGLAGFYLVPALYEQRWVNIRQALSPGLEPAQNFLYTTLGDPEHNAFNWVASSVAMLLMALTTIAALDRKSTRLNSSHGYISYAVFCLKK